MRIVSRTIPIKSIAEGVRISFLGDWHLGVANCDKKYIKGAIKTIISEPSHYVIGMGDYIDAIGAKDPRWDEGCLDPAMPSNRNVFDWQLETAYDLLAPLGKRIISLHSGNHEHTAKRATAFDLSELLAYKLHVPAAGITSYTRLKFTGRNKSGLDPVNIWCHHGTGAGRKTGAKLNRLVDTVAAYEADIYAAGHTHEIGTKFIPRIYPLREKIVAENKYYLQTGSALKASLPDYNSPNSTYVERMGLPPVAIGHVCVHIQPGRRAWSHNNAATRIRAWEVPG